MERKNDIRVNEAEEEEMNEAVGDVLEQIKSTILLENDFGKSEGIGVKIKQEPEDNVRNRDCNRCVDRRKGRIGRKYRFKERDNDQFLLNIGQRGIGGDIIRSSRTFLVKKDKDLDRKDRDTDFGKSEGIGVKIKQEPQDDVRNRDCNRCVDRRKGRIGRKYRFKERDNDQPLLNIGQRGIGGDIIRSSRTFVVKKDKDLDRKDRDTDPSSRRHKCDLCPYTTNRKSSFTRHQRIHTGDKPYVCDMCKLRFNQSFTLKKHIDSVHLKIRPYLCEICGQGCCTRWQLNTHINTVHKNMTSKSEKASASLCEVCGKHFNYSINLTRHMTTHTGEKEFICDICNMRFSQNGSLTTHKKSVHEKLRPHHCTECDYCCSRKVDLSNHQILVHNHPSKYQCEACHKYFHTPSVMKRHVGRCNSGKS